MVYVALARHWCAHALAHGRGDLELEVAVVLPHANLITRHYLCSRFDALGIELHVPGAHRISGLTAGSSFVNVADVGGVYNDQWVQAISRWVTTVYGKPTPLPRTGY